jgi:transcriptional regulator with XRE-family HTH domain
MALQLHGSMMKFRSHDEKSTQIGRLISVRRTSLKLTQADLGRAVGVTSQQIQKYESGENAVNASRLGIIANALKVPVCYFYPDDNSLSDSNVFGEYTNLLRDHQNIEILTTLNELRDSKTKAVILQLLKQMTELHVNQNDLAV